MMFRKDSLLFYQSEIFYIIAVISCLMLIPVLKIEISLLYMFPFIILTLVNPQLHNEYITIDETGISCQKSGKQIWAYGWNCIAELKRSSRFLMPSIEVIAYNEQGEINNFAYPNQYFQLGRAAREAIERYYNPTEHSANQ